MGIFCQVPVLMPLSVFTPTSFEQESNVLLVLQVLIKKTNFEKFNILKRIFQNKFLPKYFSNPIDFICGLY